MKRRDFIATSVIALAATAIPAMAMDSPSKPWQEMTAEEIARENLRRRQTGVKPNYEGSHHCPKCGLHFLCPDRYMMPECGPTKEGKRFGYSVNSMTCSPCSLKIGGYEPEGFRQLWYEANGV